MKIGIVGLGGIGQRHAHALIMQGHEIVALRTGKGQLAVNSNLKNTITECFNQEDFLNCNLDGVLIANPTSMHIKTALFYLEKGYRVFIEKPISFDAKECAELQEYKDQIIVGYCFRFSPLFRKIESKLKHIGKPQKISFCRGLSLPIWHPYADYRKEYMGSKRLGGGVVRTLSHEIDIMIKWFGKPDAINSFTDKLSNLEIDTEDYAFISCKYAEGFRVNFELDYLSHHHVSRGVFVGENGTLEFDASAAAIAAGQPGTVLRHYSKEGRMVSEEYVDPDSKSSTRIRESLIHLKRQMLDFIKFLETGKSQNASYAEALETMKIIDEVLCTSTNTEDDPLETIALDKDNYASVPAIVAKANAAIAVNESIQLNKKVGVLIGLANAYARAGDITPHEQAIYGLLGYAQRMKGR